MVLFDCADLICLSIPFWCTHFVYSIVDKDLKALRNDRWNVAFDDTKQQEEAPELTINRKATIVLEHLIQASDVAHTMQHWNVYRKWNERLLQEMYEAYLQGRSNGVDPTINWAKGEIGFFDFYIIPLAKKLKECGVFGVSSDEYLNYALTNRRKWEEEGTNITQDMISRLKNGGITASPTEPNTATAVAIGGPEQPLPPVVKQQRRRSSRKQKHQKHPETIVEEKDMMV